MMKLNNRFKKSAAGLALAASAAGANAAFYPTVFNMDLDGNRNTAEAYYIIPCDLDDDHWYTCDYDNDRTWIDLGVMSREAYFSTGLHAYGLNWTAPRAELNADQTAYQSIIQDFAHTDWTRGYAKQGGNGAINDPCPNAEYGCFVFDINQITQALFHIDYDPGIFDMIPPGAPRPVQMTYDYYLYNNEYTNKDWDTYNWDYEPVNARGFAYIDGEAGTRTNYVPPVGNVPEPGTFGLMGAGLLAAGAVASRRRKEKESAPSLG